MNLYFFRHGETEWNRQKRFQGSSDIPLNEAGREQALELKKKFSDIPIEYVLSSDLKRARQTAELIFESRDVPIEFSPSLREAHLGNVEGLYRHEFDEKYGQNFWEIWKAVKEEYLDFRFPEGESPREHLNRIKGFIEHWSRENQYQNVALSCHGGVIWRMIHFCEKNPLLPPTIPNCGLFLLSYRDGIWRFQKQI